MMAAASPWAAIQAAMGELPGRDSWRAIAGAMIVVSSGSMAQCGPRILASTSPRPTRKAVTSSGPIGSVSGSASPPACAS